MILQTKETEYKQDDLFSAPTYDVRAVFDRSFDGERVCLVGCGKKKGSKRVRSRTLYTSERAHIALNLADHFFDRAFLVSAKHGLIGLDKLISPYEFSIDRLEKPDLDRWARDVTQCLKRLVRKSAQITLLMENHYSEPLLAEMESNASELVVYAPLLNVEDRYFLEWHKQAEKYSRRLSHLEILYDEIRRLREDGKTFLLRDLGTQNMPEKGLYIFVDESEKNRWGNAGRIVRIGTHAVSDGSKSLLRTRLRSHLGNQDESGDSYRKYCKFSIGYS